MFYPETFGNFRLKSTKTFLVVPTDTDGKWSCGLLFVYYLQTGIEKKSEKLLHNSTNSPQTQYQPTKVLPKVWRFKLSKLSELFSYYFIVYLINNSIFANVGAINI